MPPRTRIAPSPTGIAHVGTIYTALINYAFAEKNKGKFIIRIEDTDRERYVPGSEQVIFSSLNWLGIPHDEGPDVGGPYEPYTQSKRLEIYKKHAQKLVEEDKAYPCFCSPERLAAMRAAQEKAKKPPMYDGRCRTIEKKESHKRARKEKHVIRLKVSKAGSIRWNDLIRGKITFANKTIDDQVLLKSDGFPTYHLAVVVDDHLMRILHVIRGEEWISSTPKHILLYKAFGWEVPKFAHTPLLRNQDRSKLSKRKDPVSVEWFKDHGFLPQALVNFLCLMGWSHPRQKEKFSLEEFVKHFSLKRIKTTQPIFDLEKLSWLNGRYIREMDQAELIKALRPFLPKKARSAKLKQILPLVQKRMHTLTEFSDYADFFFETPEVDSQLLLKQSKKSRQKTKKKISQFTYTLKKIPETEFTSDKIEAKSRNLLDDRWQPKSLFMTIRVALTGRVVSPPLFDTIVILGKKETLKRLEDVAQKF